MTAEDQAEIGRLLKEQVRTVPIRRAIENRLAALKAVGNERKSLPPSTST